MANPIKQAFAGIKELIAACPAFQAAVDEADAESAAEHIYYPDVKREATEEGEQLPTRPFAILRVDNECTWSMDVNLKRARGELKVAFEFPTAIEDVESVEALDAFMESVGQILLEMAQTSDTNTGVGGWYWKCLTFEQTFAPQLADLTRENEAAVGGEAFYAAEYKVSWI